MMARWRVPTVLFAALAALLAHADAARTDRVEQGAQRAAAAATTTAGKIDYSRYAHDDRARDDYLLHCMGCHAENGKGMKGSVPSFPDDLGRLLSSPQGRAFIQRVPGVTMSVLPSDRLAAVLNWLVAEYVEPAAASHIAPFTAEEIERMRRQPPLMDVAGARRDAGL